MKTYVKICILNFYLDYLYLLISLIQKNANITIQWQKIILWCINERFLVLFASQAENEQTKKDKPCTTRYPVVNY